MVLLVYWSGLKVIVARGRVEMIEIKTIATAPQNEEAAQSLWLRIYMHCMVLLERPSPLLAQEERHQVDPPDIVDLRGLYHLCL